MNGGYQNLPGTVFWGLTTEPATTPDPLQYSQNPALSLDDALTSSSEPMNLSHVWLLIAPGVWFVTVPCG